MRFDERPPAGPARGRVYRARSTRGPQGGLANTPKLRQTTDSFDLVAPVWLPYTPAPTIFPVAGQTVDHCQSRNRIVRPENKEDRQDTFISWKSPFRIVEWIPGLPRCVCRNDRDDDAENPTDVAAVPRDVAGMRHACSTCRDTSLPFDKDCTGAQQQGLTVQKDIGGIPSDHGCSRADKMGAFVTAFAIVTCQHWKHLPRHGMRRRRESSDL